MSANIKIQIHDPVSPDLVHRFRNFGEDIFCALKDLCSVSIEEIDLATTNFVVRDIPTRNLGDVTNTIKRLLKKHHLGETAKLKRL